MEPYVVNASVYIVGPGMWAQVYQLIIDYKSADQARLQSTFGV